MKMICLTTITLLCFSVAANAETYVCSASFNDDLFTFKREGVQFVREGGVVTMQFLINSEHDRWLHFGCSWHVCTNLCTNDTLLILYEFRSI